MGNDSQPTIMVVDDTPANLKLLDDMLRKFSYRVLTFPSGELALKAATANPPDLFLLDINMPGMSGLELCQHLKLDRVLSEIPVIFISAMTDVSEKVKAFHAGGVDYVCKPFQLEEVRARVETHLGLRRLRKDLERSIQLLNATNLKLSEKNRQMDEQLAQAEIVQRTLLPSTLPVSKQFKFHWRYEPCDLLAGDSLNIFWLDKTHIGVYLFDVSGHGVAAALMAVSVSRMLQPTNSSSSLVWTYGAEAGDVRPTPPGVVTNELNRLFAWTLSSTQFFTLVYGVLDLETLEFCYVNAGHLNPLYISPLGVFESHKGTGLPIGLGSKPYQEQTMKLQPGGRLIIYSDGITEVMDGERELWSYERLCKTMENNSHSSLDECLDDIILKTEFWAGKEGIEDDRTILGIEVQHEAKMGLWSVSNFEAII